MKSMLALGLLIAGASAAAARQELPPVPTQSAADLLANRQKANREAEARELTKCVDLWIEAGAPRLFVMCGMSGGVVDSWRRHEVNVSTGGRAANPDSSASGAQPGEDGREPKNIRGNLAPFQHLQASLPSDDPFGFGLSIASRVRGLLIDAGIDEIIESDAFAESRERLINALEGNEQWDAIQSIFSELPADYVLYVRLTPLSAGPGTAKNFDRQISVVLELKLPGSGISGGSSSFDAKMGNRTKFMDAYAHEITKRFASLLVRNLERRKSRGAPIQVKLLDAGLDELRLVEEALKSVPEFVRLREDGSRQVRGRNITDVTVRFKGDQLDLFNALTRVLPAKAKLLPVSNDRVAGRLTLTLRPLPEARDPATMSRREILMAENDPRRAQIIETLLAEYKNEGSPRIGVLVNRGLLDADLEGAAGEKLKKAMDRDRLSIGRLSTFRGPVAARNVDGQALDTEAMLNAMRGEFSKFTGPTVDLTQARSLLEKSAAVNGNIFDDDKMSWLIREFDGADLVVRCTGRRQASNPPSYKYTFNVLRIATAEIIAIAEESVQTSDFSAGRDPLENLARRATADLIDQMLTAWAPPRTIRVTVLRATTQEQVLAVMEAFQLHFRSGVQSAIIRETASDGSIGVGMFDLKWDGDLTALVEAIAERKDMLPFDIDETGIKPNAITIRIKDAIRLTRGPR